MVMFGDHGSQLLWREQSNRSWRAEDARSKNIAINIAGSVARSRNLLRPNTHHIAHMKSVAFRFCFQAAGLILLAGVLNSKAATGTDTWIGGGANALWSNAANWSGVNAPPAAGDTPTFGASFGAGGTTLNNDLTAGTSFAGLTFNSAAVSYTLTGNSIASSAGIADNSPNLETINLNLAFSSTHSLTAAAGSSLLVGGVNGAIDAQDSFSDLGGTPPASAYYRLRWLP